MTSKPAIVGIAGKRMRLDVHVWEQLVSPPGKCVNAHSVREGLNELDHIVLVGFVGTSTRRPRPGSVSGVIRFRSAASRERYRTHSEEPSRFRGLAMTKAAGSRNPSRNALSVLAERSPANDRPASSAQGEVGGVGLGDTVRLWCVCSDFSEGNGCACPREFRYLGGGADLQ